ncbi:MAG: CusA/CzcA family heavy metal efflux RND transporter [Halioglobus sp.]
MIERLIRLSIQHRGTVILLTLILVGLSLNALRNTPVDAIPDLSDVQVIIKTSVPGQAPQVVQDQVTYPLTTAMLAVPKASTVRGYSFFGDSYVYIIFEEGTDIYWARSRVLEYLSQVRGRLPADVQPELGPDATGVGWVYQYALTDRSGNMSLAELRTLQDWFLRFELQTVPGVAEVATVGGMVKQYQVVVDPNKLRAFDIPLQHIRTAIARGNQEAGASVIEMAEAEYMVRASGYLKSVADLGQIPLGLNDRGVPIVLADVARISEGPQMRRGIAELNGEGEVVGGIVVMRYGENAQATIAGVKARLEQLKSSLPAGVEVVEVYDRSRLIDAAIDNLSGKLTQELLVVAMICAVFLFHLRSSLVVIISLPVAVLASFLLMRWQGINANIMSLGGIAIAIGAMVDGAIVMLDNLHRHAQNEPLTDENRWQVVGNAAAEVGRPLFFSLLIITVSFVPVFALQAQEGRLFSPLAYTKTYAMAAATILAVTLVPVLMGYFVRGHISSGNNPLNRLLVNAYRPLLRLVMRIPKTICVLALLLMTTALWPISQIGGEFMPPLDEGDLMYMPSTYPGISIGKARELLQQTDRLIASVPEVETVFGKIGRAATATDPAPLTMIETTIQFKPRDQWRSGLTKKALREELESLVQFPGVSNSWVMPIKTRIDMQVTGIKTELGIKVAGPDLKVIGKISQQLEQVLSGLETTESVYTERVVGGRYIEVDIDRGAASRYGLNVADVHQVISTAIGGSNVTETIEGLERFPVNLRYPQRYRDSVEQLKLLPIVTPSGGSIVLADVAKIDVVDGPPSIKSENARLTGWTYISLADTDITSYVEQASALIAKQVQLPSGYSLVWAGQYEYMERAKARLLIVVPLTLLVIIFLLYMHFRNPFEVMLIVSTLPLALVGGVWFIWFQDYQVSVAVAVGLIALAGVSVEIGVLMLTYLEQAWQTNLRQSAQESRPANELDLRAAIIAGAGMRVRPIMMTVLATIAGLVPAMLGEGAGSEVLQRIAGPMIGGLVTSLLMSLLLIPALFFLRKRRDL